MEVSVFIFCDVIHFREKQNMLAGFNQEEDWYQILQLWLGRSQVGLAVQKDGAERDCVLVDQEDGGEVTRLYLNDALLGM